MSDFDFIAWSLAISGIIAILIYGFARIAAAMAGKPPNRLKPVEQVSVIAQCVSMGGVLMRFIADVTLDLQPPRWSELLIGAMFLIMGISNLVTAPRDGIGYSSSRTMAYFLAGMGILILVLEAL